MLHWCWHAHGGGVKFRAILAQHGEQLWIIKVIIACELPWGMLIA